MTDVQLGAFALLEPLGRGGMGVVWRARHVTTGTPVAVKVMRPAQGSAGGWLEAFQGEVRAVAAMDHHAIVAVFDSGLIAEDTRIGDQLLVGGSPWLAMELASGGTLAERAGRLDWTELRTILLTLLEALAHAHARGVIHRDLKPANVLVCGDGDLRSGLLLTDFGLAHAGAADRADNTELASGTPAYMAPEQLAGHFRDYGPWTDLYALGVLGFELASGERPVTGDGIFAIAYAHVKGQRAPFVPRIPVPDGFEDWLLWLLAPEPGARPPRAADAAWALAALGDPVGLDAETTLDIPLRVEDLPTIQARERVGDLQTMALAADHPSSGVARAVRAVPQGPGRHTVRTRPPVPASWRSELVSQTSREERSGSSLRLAGAGLGLWGLRTIPLVGRDAERSALWSGLVRVAETGRPAAAVVRGPSGAGKSRLAAWLAWRGHELGAVEVIEAVWSPEPTPGDGLATALARHAGVLGLDREQAEQRLEILLRADGVEDPWEWRTLASLLVPVVAEPAAENLGSIDDQRRVLLRQIRRVAARRPVLLLLDDAQWGEEAFAAARVLLEDGESRPAPVFTLLTVRDEALAERSGAREALGSLLACPGVLGLPLAALRDDEQRRLVRDLLGIDADLARRVEERTAGNPLFAVQLVGDWVERGVLQLGASGFTLAPGASTELPHDLSAVWATRIERVLRGLPPESREALAVAAVLGLRVAEGEWRSACAALGYTPPAALRQRLLDGRLAVGGGEDWSFVHGMLREAILAPARRGGRWAALHAACADVLRPAAERGEGGVAERLAAHLEQAARPVEAAPWLLQASRERASRGEGDAARSLVDRYEVALSGVDPEDRRHADGWYQRLLIATRHAHMDEVDRIARRLEAVGRRHGWSELVADALEALGDQAHQRDELDAADAFLTEARALYAALDPPAPDKLANCVRMQANVARLRGDLDGAMALFAQARAIIEEHSSPVRLAGLLRDTQIVTTMRGRLDESAALCRQAREIYEETGDRIGLIYVLNSMGNIAVLRDDPADAEALYRRAFELDQEIRCGVHWLAAINLSVLLQQLGRPAEALTFANHALDELDGGPRRSFQAAALSGKLGCTAWTGDLERYDAELARLRALLDETGFTHSTLARGMEYAGDAVVEADPLRAAAVWRLAADHWDRNAKEGRASALRSRADRLERP